MKNTVDFEKLQAERDSLAVERSVQKEHWHKVYRNASHDMKEPLRMVCTYASLLKAEHLNSLDATGQEYLGYVIEGATRLRKQTESLLKLFSLEFQQVQQGMVSMDDALFCALSTLKQQIAEKKINVHTNSLQAAWGNTGLLTELFHSLLDNAIKFAPESRPAHITIRSSVKDGMITYSITDDGDGVPKESLSEIFEPFRRLRPRNLFVGEGLGLAFCRRVVELHGGTIWAETGTDGFAVHFSLPVGESPGLH